MSNNTLTIETVANYCPRGHLLDAGGLLQKSNGSYTCGQCALEDARTGMRRNRFRKRLETQFASLWENGVKILRSKGFRHEDAEDAVSQAFVELMGRGAPLTDQNLENLVVTVALRRATNAAKRRVPSVDGFSKRKVKNIEKKLFDDGTLSY